MKENIRQLLGTFSTRKFFNILKNEVEDEQQSETPQIIQTEEEE